MALFEVIKSLFQVAAKGDQLGVAPISLCQGTVFVVSETRGKDSNGDVSLAGLLG
jgi:hypothetical protein